MKIQNIQQYGTTATTRKHAKTALKYFIDNNIDACQAVFVNRMDFKFEKIADGIFRVFKWETGNWGASRNQTFRGKTGRWSHEFDIHTHHEYTKANTLKKEKTNEHYHIL